MMTADEKMARNIRQLIQAREDGNGPRVARLKVLIEMRRQTAEAIARTEERLQRD